MVDPCFISAQADHVYLVNLNRCYCCLHIINIWKQYVTEGY